MQENQSLLDLQVDAETSANLTEVSRWAKFMGVLVLVAIALVFLMFAFLWNRLEPMIFSAEQIESEIAGQAKIIFMIVLLIAACIIGLLMFFLIKGATRIRASLRNRDQFLFNSGFGNLRNYFIMYGVLSIIGLLFDIVGLL
jgi:hypothetical protein